MTAFISVVLSLTSGVWSQADSWTQAERNAGQVRKVLHFANRNSCAWLAHADPRSGLLPRNLRGDAIWNARDCAADNYPFITLTGVMTGNFHLQQTSRFILEQEQQLANRIGSMPDDFVFATQSHRSGEPNLGNVIFGAAEYCKDGLIPLTEWMGPSPWLDRMKTLIDDIWKHAPIDTPAGRVPSLVLEVNGDLLQTMGRLYWMTRDPRYKEWSYRLADFYLIHTSLMDNPKVALRDHGCEIIGGLTEAYLIAAREDPERHDRYKAPLYALLDDILAHGTNADGQMYIAYDPHTGKPSTTVLSDGWGYVYNGYITVSMADREPRYLEAVRKAMANVHKYPAGSWDNGVDQNADAIEGAINLLNRLPEPKVSEWLDTVMQSLFDAQRPDGTIEGWYGDGNSTRTALMYGLWKTQGLTAAPWPEELMIGSVREPDGTLRVWLRSDYAWSGHLRFDRPRHKEFFHMPVDYPRINQWPEWFTVDREVEYRVQREGVAEGTVTGETLLSYPFALKPGEPARLTIQPVRATSVQNHIRE